MLQVERAAKLKTAGLLQTESERYTDYVRGFRDINGLHEKLSTMSTHLKQYSPKPDGRYTSPKFETDWHEALLEIGISALQANLTNVLTIASGRGEYFGAWKGLGVRGSGHGLGHNEQVGNPDWIKIRQYNCQMLDKLMKALEAIPEGSGSMMDNTLIVYTSNNADKQHTDGSNWPFVLLGNGGGRFKTGQHTRIDGRPINDLYATFLHGVGTPGSARTLEEIGRTGCGIVPAKKQLETRGQTNSRYQVSLFERQSRGFTLCSGELVWSNFERKTRISPVNQTS